MGHSWKPLEILRQNPHYPMLVGQWYLRVLWLTIKPVMSGSWFFSCFILNDGCCVDSDVWMGAFLSWAGNIPIEAAFCGLALILANCFLTPREFHREAAMRWDQMKWEKVPHSKDMASDWPVERLLLRSAGGLPVTYRHSLCIAL